MKPINWVRLCGLAMIVGGLTSFPFLLGAGFLGLYLQFRDQLGRIERVALLVGAGYQFVFAGIVFIVIPLLFPSGDLSGLSWFEAFSLFSAVLPFICLFIFGLRVYRQRLMEAWSFLPASVGLIWSLFILAGLPVGVTSWQESGGVVNYLGVFAAVYTFMGLVVMGVWMVRGEGEEINESEA